LAIGLFFSAGEVAIYVEPSCDVATEAKRFDFG
jgi:hypothetical protein